jgi:hypothetical protein
MTPLLALWQTHYTQWTIFDWLVLIVAVAAAIGVLFIVLKVFKVEIPPWFIQIMWIMAAAFVAIFAIRLLSTM